RERARQAPARGRASWTASGVTNAIERLPRGAMQGRAQTASPKVERRLERRDGLELDARRLQQAEAIRKVPRLGHAFAAEPDGKHDVVDRVPFEILGDAPLPQ